MVAFPKKVDRELVVRSASGLGIGLGVLISLFLGGWLWFAVASAIALLSLWEYYGLVSTQTHVSRGVGLIGVFALISLAFKGPSYDSQLLVIALSALVLFCLEVLRRQFTGESFALGNVGGTLGGMIFLGLPWSFLVVLRQQPWGLLLLLTLFLCTWSCDVSAYLVGTRWGRNPFCPQVSPKKSWEGFWGGVCGSLLCSGVLAFSWEFPPMPLLLLGFLCGTAGQLGDLAESVLKREAGVKDSGSIIPGHGGFLDRFDSILFNATLAFFIFEVIWF